MAQIPPYAEYQTGLLTYGDIAALSLSDPTGVDCGDAFMAGDMKLADEVAATQTFAVVNPSETLGIERPYGVTISNDQLKELSKVDPHAAWIVIGRMKVEGVLMSGSEMYQGQYDGQNRFTGWTGIDDAEGDAEFLDAEFEILPDDHRNYISFRATFDGPSNPTITVESYFTRKGDTKYHDFKRTIVTLSEEPVSELMVWASDNYMAPIYEVEGFQVQD